LLFFTRFWRVSLVAGFILEELSCRFTFVISLDLFFLMALLLFVRLPQLEVLVLLLSLASEFEFLATDPTLCLNLRPFLLAFTFSVRRCLV